ncbi:hypothetical protein STANM337S_02614 [Streptomyces tanashiensis]
MRAYARGASRLPPSPRRQAGVSGSAQSAGAVAVASSACPAAFGSAVPPPASWAATSSAAVPATRGVAKLLPVREARPPPGAAPSMSCPGARSPWVRKAPPQLLMSSGEPSAAAAPTARTEGTAAGTWRVSAPSLPTAETTRTPWSSQSRRARSRRASAWPASVRSPPLMLMTWAPSSTARSMARARSIWGTRPFPPSGKTGRSRPRQCGAIPVTGVPGMPNRRLATWVPCSDIGPEPAGSCTSVTRRVRSAPAKQGWDRSTGPSSRATHTRGSPYGSSGRGRSSPRTARGFISDLPSVPEGTACGKASRSDPGVSMSAVRHPDCASGVPRAFPGRCRSVRGAVWPPVSPGGTARRTALRIPARPVGAAPGTRMAGAVTCGCADA